VEYLDSVWQIGIIALVAGVMIGALAYRLLAPSIKQADQIKSELDTARDELDSYKASVGQHFNKTSELVNDLTATGPSIDRCRRFRRYRGYGRR
jgi:uncharacterized membrane-anchored protein YhcB (DUF1043 family)